MKKIADILMAIFAILRPARMPKRQAIVLTAPFGRSRQLLNIGQSGLREIEKGCRAYGDTSKITNGVLGKNLEGDVTGISGVVNRWLSGIATDIVIHLSGNETGDIRFVAAEKRRLEEKRKIISSQRVGA